MTLRARFASLALSLCVTASIVASARPQDAPKTEPRMQQPGPPNPTGSPQFQSRIAGEAAVGEAAPDFELDSSTGRPMRLSSHRGRWVVLVFGDRKEVVAPMAAVAASLDSARIQLIGVCNEKAYFLEQFARQRRFPFPVLADVTREIADMYGLYDPRERYILPGFVMIDPRGNVQFAILGQVIPPADIARLARYVAARP